MSFSVKDRPLYSKCWLRIHRFDQFLGPCKKISYISSIHNTKVLSLKTCWDNIILQLSGCISGYCSTWQGDTFIFLSDTIIVHFVISVFRSMDFAVWLTAKFKHVIPWIHQRQCFECFHIIYVSWNEDFEQWKWWWKEYWGS